MISTKISGTFEKIYKLSNIMTKFLKFWNTSGKFLEIILVL